MATEVAALVARLEADTRKFDRGMKGAEKRLKRFDNQGKTTRKNLGKTDSAMGNLTKSVKGFAVAAGVAFATRAVVNFAKDAIGAASDLGESINAVEVVFGDAAEGIKSLGVDAAEAVGLSNAEFNTLAVGFAAFVEKIDAGGDDVVGVMKELTGRAADFASVMNIDVAEAATIFRSGLAGETEPLRKFGIDLSAVTVTQKALALGLAETSSELTEQDKIIARYNLLMEQTKKTQGDFANTSDQLANAMRRLTSKFENAKAQIGDALIPTIEDLLPLLEEGIDLVVGWAIGLGQLTGSISDADAAVRRAKLGLDKEATAIEFLVGAIEKLSDESASLFFPDFLAVEADIQVLVDEFGNLAETFGLTAEDAGFMRKNAEELADELGTTEDVVLSLADRLDKDLVKAMNNIAAKEGIKLLQNTRDIRDAVLDGTDAVFDLIEAEEDLERQQKDLADAMEDARDKTKALVLAERELRTAYMEAADPIFALAQSITRAAEAEEIYNEFVATGTQLTDDGRDAAFEYAGAIADVEANARALNESGVQAGLQRLADLLGLSKDEARLFLIEAGLIDALRLDTEVGFQFNLSPADRALFNFLQGGSTRTGGGTTIIPTIPTFNIGGIAHQGGVVPGPPGVTVPILAQGGETIRTGQQERALQGGGVSIVVNGFVGSELQLAAQIDKLLTRRSKTSKLGF